mmetsp:Transcript_35062/g.51413  ORF Transcript_35062/g.51413 Transcript_35062/m.51413 type:complete len:83 (-) Transcript_35062:2073-2321(-)
MMIIVCGIPLSIDIRAVFYLKKNVNLDDIIYTFTIHCLSFACIPLHPLVYIYILPPSFFFVSKERKEEKSHLQYYNLFRCSN